MDRRPRRMRVEPPPGWPAWLAEQRTLKGWTQKDVWERVPQFGWQTVTVYGNIERGTRSLSEDEEIALAALYGKNPADVPLPDQQEPTPDLAAAIVSLTRELEAMRLERARWAAWARGVAGAFRAYEGGQVSADLLDALMPPLHEDAHPETTGTGH